MEAPEEMPALFEALARRVAWAREKHPVFATGSRQAIAVIEAEMAELKWARMLESRQRQIDEALDVMATCARFILGEFKAQ